MSAHDSSSGPQASDQPTIDPATIETLLALGGDDDPGLLTELIDLYLEDAGERLQTLEAAVSRDDVETVARTAHALKSSSANIGALTFSLFCKDIEARARNKVDVADVADLVEQCGSMFSEVADVLRDIRSSQA